MWVADYSLARPGGAALRNAGASGVVRYIGPYRNDGAIITADEYRDLVGNGLQVGLVMEYAADFLLNGYAWCKQMADGARQQEAAMGIPHGVIYGANDWDVTLGGAPQSAAALDNCKRSLDGLHGMADALGGWQYVRPYGSKWFCEWAVASAPMTGAWSTQAWSWVPGTGFSPATTAKLFQYASWPGNVPFVAGCDFNAVLGDWAPHNGAAPAPGPSPSPAEDANDMFPDIDTNGALDMAHHHVYSLQGMLAARGAWISPRNHDQKILQGALKWFQTAAKLTPDGVAGPATKTALATVKLMGEH